MMSTDEAKLAYARDLMGQKRYDEAREILETIPDNPQAQSWLMTIDQLAPKQRTWAKKKDAGPVPEWMAEPEQVTVEDDPYGQAEFLDGSDAPVGKRKRGTDFFPGGIPVKDFTVTAVVLLMLYWAIWPVGFAANLFYLREARRLNAEGAPVKGAGCLWALIFANVLPFLAVCLIVTLLWTQGTTQADIVDSLLDWLEKFSD